MLSDEGKTQIQKMITHTQKVISSKRKELEEFGNEEADNISVFMKAGETPSSSNDPELQSRFNRLIYSTEKLSSIQRANSDTINQISFETEFEYIKNMKKELSKLEEDINSI